MDTKKMNPNELCDEALDAVSGGANTRIIIIPELIIDTDSDKASENKSESTANNIENHITKNRTIINERKT